MNNEIISLNNYTGDLFYQTPKWLFNMLINKEITRGGYLVYNVMYDRLKLSNLNNWVNKEGNLYIIYPYTDLMFDLQRSRQTISDSIEQLKKLNLIISEKEFSKASKYFLLKPLTTVVRENRPLKSTFSDGIYNNLIYNNLIKNIILSQKTVSNETCFFALKVDNNEIKEEIEITSKTYHFLTFFCEIYKNTLNKSYALKYPHLEFVEGILTKYNITNTNDMQKIINFYFDEFVKTGKTSNPNINHILSKKIIHNYIKRLI